jgi:Porin subfamily
MGSQAKTDPTPTTLNWRSHMTLIKSILLGSAAGIIAVASAEAADLPTRKAAPVEYVKICNVGGITGWTLPGSDTCVKFSGYITAQFTGGNLGTQYNWGSVADAAGIISVTNPALGAALGGLNDTRLTQRVLIAASPAQQNTSFYRDETGWSIRTNFGFDMASNTAYGPLIGHFDINVDASNGFDALEGPPEPNIAYLNTGYLTWAGITAGKAQSFFSFTGGGDNFANFFSPDRKGFNEPYLMAYTASFGGGFSATFSAESPGSVGASGGGTQETGAAGANQGPIGGYDPATIGFGGMRWPDFVGALHVKQGWGEAQLSGVIHDVNVYDIAYDNSAACGLSGTLGCNAQHQQVGWALDAGVKINLPSFGAGDDFLITGEYGQSATWYSGLTGEAMWGESGQTNGNGQPLFLPDAFFNPLTNQWSKPTTWSLTFLAEHHFTPQFYIDLEGSVGQFRWSNMGGGCNLTLPSCIVSQAVQGPLSPNGTAWLIGADLGWNPVTNLNFDLELMYEDLNQASPSGFLGTIYNWGGPNEVFVPGDWKGNSSGFAGRLRITRYF